MKRIFIQLLSVLIFVSCTKHIPDNPQRYSGLTGDYMGQTPTDTTASVFGLGVVSTGMNERDAAFTPNLDEFYYSIWQSSQGTIVRMKRENDNWTGPEVVSFSGIYNDIEPCISKDGSKLFFSSNRPVEGSEPKDYDIWYVERDDSGSWGKPKNLGPAINSASDEFYPSLTDNGDLYFTSANQDALGDEDIFVSKYENGAYQKYENLGGNVNSTKGEFNSFIARDGSYLIYTTMDFGEGFGGGDLWICFKENNRWQKPVNMGSAVNTNKLEYCPYVTPDNKYLFFTSTRVNDRKYDKQRSYEELVDEYNHPYNGAGDIYWINADIINKLK